MTTPLPPQDPREPEEMLPGEAELAALYRQLPLSEPGPTLDAAVLRAAAQALAPGVESPAVLRERRKAARERGDWVHPKPVVSSPAASPSADGRSPRWLIALGSAASLVLAAGLAWHMRAPPPTTLAPAASDSAAPAQAALPSATTPAAAMPTTEAAAAPPAEPVRQAPPKRVATQSKPKPAADTLRKAVADASAERASSKARSTGSLRRAAAPAPLAAPATAVHEVSSNAVEAAPEAPAMMVAPAPAPSIDAATAAGTGDTPARELDDIQKLFKQGRDDEARQRLSAFQRAHPQWDLPPELRAQLRKP